MDATPINFDTAIPLGTPVAAPESVGAEAAARKWTLLHDAAFVVATLAGARPAQATEMYGFPAALARAPRWRRDLAEQGLDDLAAILEPGLAALIAVHRRGGDAGAPARALWQEFTAARDALLGMVLPHD